MKKRYKRYKIIIIVVLAIIILGFLFYDGIINKIKDQKETKENIKEISVLETLIKDSSTEVRALLAVNESSSYGTAYRLLKDGKIYHVVVADMPDPKRGSFYEGWLVQDDLFDFFSTGVMQKNEDGQWVLIYTANKEFENHKKVVITEEAIVDATPEDHVIEGEF